MEKLDIISLIPLMILAGASVVIMLMIAVKRNHQFTVIFSLLAFAASLISLGQLSSVLPRQIQSMMLFDEYALYFMVLLLISALIITILSYDYIKQFNENKEEYYILLFLGTLGAGILVVANHFATFFLGLELLSVSLYVMIAYLRQRDVSVEAGAKYLVLAAASSAFLLFGMALVYSQAGTMFFPELGNYLLKFQETTDIMMLGFAMMFVGISFKLALVPFHMWTPDVYQGSPVPVTGFIATVSKGGIFAVLFRFFAELNLYTFPNIMMLFMIIAIASMFTGNFLALLQKNVKRILAYSSIAHFGYLLIAFIAGKQLGLEAASFYLLAYFVTILGAFGIVSLISDREKDMDNVTDYRGLFWRQPWLAVIFSGMLLSLAGIPLTAGFVGKFYIALAGVEAGELALVIILAVNSVIGLYYYLRIMVMMFSPVAGPEVAINKTLYRTSMSSLAILSLLFVALLWFGVFPQSVIDFIRMVVVL
ncbi:MAG: NADH-quinone oxidoreductase subunit N [Bacteroidales bacterium]|nr:NADH-quinone oxidoreductase subunit N [Bacteroidales bacterium]